VTPEPRRHTQSVWPLDEELRERAAIPSETPRLGVLLQAGTGVVDAAAVVGSLLVLGLGRSPFLPALAVAWLLLLRTAGAYRRGLGYPLGAELKTMSVAALFGGLLLLQLGPTVGLQIQRTGASALAVPVVLFLFGRVVLRGTSEWLRTRRSLVRRVLLVGDGPDAHELLENIAAWPGLGVEVVGVCADTTAPDVHGLPVLGLTRSCGLVARHLGLRTVILAPAALSSEESTKIHSELLDSEVEVVLAPNVAHLEAARLSTRQFGGLPVLRLQNREDRTRRASKRLFDLGAASFLLLLSWPFLLVAAVVIRLDSPGPAFFRQVRVGKGGALFEVWKFRTMRFDADAMLAELLETNGKGDGGALFKLRRDPRVTRFGRWLRRTSLDELPQLWNVLKGEMSLVGPRPALPHEVAEFDDFTLRRLRVKPGITGLWQVSGRADATFATYSRMDAFYAENWTFLGDLRILLRTVPVVVRAKGAY